MNVDRSPMWIGLADLLLCILSVVIVAVAPTKAKVDGVKPKAEFLITADWKVELDSDVDLWIVGPDKKPIFYGARESGCVSLDRAKGASSIPVRVEVTGLNPQVTTLFAMDVALDQVGQTINVASFNLSPD